MGKIPGKVDLRFYEKGWVVECFAVVPPIIVVGVAAVANLLDPSKIVLGWVLVAAMGWLLVASGIKVWYAYTQYKKEKRKDDYDGLLGALNVLHSSIAGTNNDGRLRATIHRVVPPEDAHQDPEELEQLLPYVGGKGKDAGRKFSIRSGIIGRAAREATPFAFSRVNEDHEAFINELKSDWAYTDQDARRLTADRCAWMAVPIMSKTEGW